MEQFKEELEYYRAHRDELLSKYEWKYAIIKGSQLVGVFDHAALAYQEGLARFGNVPLFIKQVLRDEPVQQIPALSLGILVANR